MAKNNRPQSAKIVARILKAVPMVQVGEACELLGLSGSNRAAKLNRKEKLLRFMVAGRTVYPLFQFDAAHHRIYPALIQIIARKPAAWSDVRLLHWLTREHVDFGGTPAAALGNDAEAVIAAFVRESEPQVHG